MPVVPFIRRITERLASRTSIELLSAGLVAALLTVAVSNLPKMDLLESAINDDNFTDLLLTTRGELPIDTNIRILTYDASILDTFDMVDRSMLALQLAALFELEPRVVGVDFLIETARPEAGDGDAMLAGLIAERPNLILGIFHEDSLDRFRMPPGSFKIPERQLGCINLLTDDDNTIRSFRPVWGSDGKKRFESFDVKIARAVDSNAAAYLLSFDSESFVIDYAAGIGEVQRQGSAGDQIFPVMPLRAVFEIVASGDSIRTAALRREFQGKAVLVGYGDVRNTQVTSIVDRFYTPFKPEKNTLPDMHGVAIHANIVNSILKRRVLAEMPAWANVIWSTILVAVLLAGRKRTERIRRPTQRTLIRYCGFALLFLLAALFPVLAYRYTPYKFSIFMPIGALLLAVPTLEGLQKGIDLLLDMRRRARLRRGVPEPIQQGMLEILKAWTPHERVQRALHFVQTEFATICAALFAEAAAGRYPQFPSGTLAAPTLARLIAATTAVGETNGVISPRATALVRLLHLLNTQPGIRQALHLARSLSIAMNEIRRQQLETEASAGERAGAFETEESGSEVVAYADLALKTLTSQGSGDNEEQFDELYEALESYAEGAALVLAGAADPGARLYEGSDAPPYVLLRRCNLHGTVERFVYICEQENANNRDDFFDLVYAGRTFECQPADHPGLSEFREVTAAARVDA